MSEWQPIETAPRDRDIMIAEIFENKTINEIDIGAWGFIENSDWDGAPVYGWLSNNGRIEEPTHWHEPLAIPEPPK